MHGNITGIIKLVTTEIIMDGDLFEHSSLMKLGKEELCNIILKLGNIGSQIRELKSTITDIAGRLERTESELAVSNNANSLLVGRINQLEERAVVHERIITSDGQYLRNREVEIRRLPVKAVATLLSLTEVRFDVLDIGKCHKLGGDGKSVILEMKCREKRDEMLLSRKRLKNKGEELESMDMGGVIIVESMCREYARLDFIFRSLRKRGEIHETWFFNGRLNMKRVPNSRRIQVSHIEDLYEQFDKILIDDILSVSKRLSTR